MRSEKREVSDFIPPQIYDITHMKAIIITFDLILMLLTVFPFSCVIIGWSSAGGICLSSMPGPVEVHSLVIAEPAFARLEIARAYRKCHNAQGILQLID